MKHKLLVAVGAVLAAAAVSVLVYVRNGNNAMDEFFNANVEALARSEGSGFGPMCSQTGNPGTYRMKLCSNCNGNLGNYAMDRVAYCNN
ncbi:MAG: hypothetical protein NC308_04370 [Clostridium sp.]|nr:hypothetical protein [Bacteroides sp.]MCM1198102.1 hypothetical protein [Clostridium sp.]